MSPDIHGLVVQLEAALYAIPDAATGPEKYWLAA
jgi:hypothetical protein